MGKWKMVPLKNVTTLMVDGDWVESKDQSQYGIRLVQTGNIGEGEYLDKPNNAKYISEETFNRLKCTEVFEGDVLVSRLPSPVGRACVLPPSITRMITAVDCTITRFNNLCLPKYFMYFSKSQNYLFQVAKHFAGSTRVRISRKNLETISIPLPPLENQKQIAKTLDTAAELLAMYKQQLAELDNLIKATFYDMFGDPVTNEKGWKVVELGSVAKLRGGFAFKSKDYVDNGIKLVQIANVHKDVLTWDEINYLPINYLTKYPSFILKENDIVLAMTRPIIKSLDAVKIAVVSQKDIPCLLNQRVGRFELNHDAINSIFLLEFCRSQYFKNAVELFGSNSLQPNVSSKQVESVMCFLPSISLQNQFAEFVTRIEEQKVFVKKAIDETQYLFDCLMSKYFE